MTQSALERAFGDALVKLPGAWIYGGAVATHAVDDVEIAGRRFRAMFQMNAESGALQQVLLEPVRRRHQEMSFDAVFDVLRAEYGAPRRVCTVPRAGGGPLSIEYWWRFPTTTVHLTFFDFFTRAIAAQDPNTEPDPRTPSYETRRNNPRFLPRRAVLRYHPTARGDLMSATCR